MLQTLEGCFVLWRSKGCASFGWFFCHQRFKWFFDCLLRIKFKQLNEFFQFKLQLVKVVSGSSLEKIECWIDSVHSQHFECKTEIKGNSVWEELAVLIRCIPFSSCPCWRSKERTEFSCGPHTGKCSWSQQAHSCKEFHLNLQDWCKF